jgi:hypothetical protein
VEKACFVLLYRAAPNFEVAGQAISLDRETVANHIDKAGIPRKKHKRKGQMGRRPKSCGA